MAPTTKRLFLANVSHNEYHNQFVTKITPRKTEYYDGVPNNGVPMDTNAEFTAKITPRRDEYHADGVSLYTGIATGITHRDNEHYNEDCISPNKYDETLNATITPRNNTTKNEIIDFAPAVPDQSVVSGPTPKTNTSEDNVILLMVTGNTPTKNEILRPVPPRNNEHYGNNRIAPNKYDKHLNAKITHSKIEYHDEFVTENTSMNNTSHENIVLSEDGAPDATITPSKKYHNDVVTGITPKK